VGITGLERARRLPTFSDSSRCITKSACLSCDERNPPSAKRNVDSSRLVVNERIALNHKFAFGTSSEQAATEETT